MQKWTYCTLEWISNANSIRVTMPTGQENAYQGSYIQVTQILNQLGQDGWEVVGCASAGTWLLWTLKRPA